MLIDRFGALIVAKFILEFALTVGEAGEPTEDESYEIDVLSCCAG